MRIIVTGGAGFIGSNLVHVLVQAHDVCVIDDLSSGSPDNLHPGAVTRTMDILDSRLPEVFAEFAPEVVVHLAAQPSVAASFADPERDRAVNVEGTRAVARAARTVGARRVLSASSAAVYGEPAEIPLREGSRTEPVNPYGVSKLSAEEVLADELADSGCDFASLRFSNVYGPRQDATGEGGVVAVFCQALAGGETPVIYGDGIQTRDFIFVGDVVGALLTAIAHEEALGGQGAAGAYNISTGTETTVQALADTLRPVAGFFAPFEYGSEREGDVRRSALDPAKAADVLGWRASVPLATGLGPTFRWFAQR